METIKSNGRREACQIFQLGYWKLVLLWEPALPSGMISAGSMFRKEPRETFHMGGSCWWQSLPISFWTADFHLMPMAFLCVHSLGWVKLPSIPSLETALVSPVVHIPSLSPSSYLVKALQCLPVITVSAPHRGLWETLRFCSDSRELEWEDMSNFRHAKSIILN